MSLIGNKGWFRMVEERVLVVGLGEVGRPLYELLKECKKFEVHGYDLNTDRMRDTGQSTALPDSFDVMHVCIPCKDKGEFVESIAGYVERFKPKLLIINSTVAPGTTVNVYKRVKGACLVAHSPIRGVHKSLEHMKWELRRWTKYVGGVDKKSAEEAKKHFEKAGFKTKILKSCLETELAKLFETTYRAWMIACFQEMHRISRHFGADFDDVVDFIEDTHRVRLDRPVMFPDIIGGHCLIPNTELLLQSYNSKFLHLILESNEQRKKEINDQNIKEEIEKIKKRTEILEKDLLR
ncbi:MAG: GDP-mannose dehydrogenase [Candidatus Bathyarchaeota archaeon]|nr:GDP-mannose dehydrogenase [Candidatus Bathyarchaeota archaeon]